MENDIMTIPMEHSPQSRIHEVDFDNIPFGRTFSDHMFQSEYRNGSWQHGRITPFRKLEVSPSLHGLHYGQTIFEGLKAYRQESGDVVLFRPADNFERLNRSAERMCMPSIDVDFMVEALRELVALDIAWVPRTPNASLYIRPFMFASDEFFGVRPSENYRLVIFTGPVGPYYNAPIKVLAETFYTRAVRGGTGSAKAGGNYGGALFPAKLAQDKGYNQLIWTDASEHRFVEESGTMNVAFFIGDRLVTPPAGGTILRGITRDSVLTLAKEMGYKVEERPVSMEEVAEAFRLGQLHDAFGMGTAATIAPIALIGYKGEDMELPPVEGREISNRIAKRLSDIRYGRAEDVYGWTVKV